MIKLSKERRDKLLIAAVSGGGIILVLYFLVIASQRDQLSKYQAKVMDLSEKVSKAEAMSKMGPSITELLAGLKKTLDSKQEDMVLRGDPYYSFFQMMERFRKAHAVEVIDIGQPVMGDAGLMPNFPYKAATFTVVVSAYYSDLGRFVADLENDFPFWSLSGVSIHPEGAARNRLMAGNELPNGSVRPNAGPAEGSEKLAIELKIVTLVRPTTL